jgi:hypothetical protein
MLVRQGQAVSFRLSQAQRATELVVALVLLLANLCMVKVVVLRYLSENPKRMWEMLF